MAVKAFDAEIATIAHSVKTIDAATIRYGFWCSALERIRLKKTDIDGHPLVEDLSKSNLSSTQMYWLEGSLKARAESLDRRIYSISDLDDYAHKSLVPILWCVNQIAKEGPNTSLVDQEHVLDHLGKAQLTIRRLKGLAKALSAHNPLAEQFIPIGLLGRFGLNGPKMIESLNLKQPGDLKSLSDVVHELASHAHTHLSLINPAHEQSDLFVRLSKYSSLRYLEELEKRNFLITHPALQRIGSHRDGILPIKLYMKTIIF